MRSAPRVTRGFFPLDEELELLPGALTPSLVETIVRLGTWMPFVSVTKGVTYFCKVDLAEATARRKTEEAGRAYVEVQTTQVDALERGDDLPTEVGARLLQMSVDGAMVPLLHQAWGEVKTLAIGVVGQPIQKKGEWEVHTEQLSYFSRMIDHETFARLATVETHRRGIETAQKVCAINDGAEWEQKFVDDQRFDAVRILDWGHGAEHVAEVGRALHGTDTPAARTWLSEQLTELKTGDSAQVLADLGQVRDGLAVGTQAQVDPTALRVVTSNLEYFEKRREQIRYREFEQAGYPIGSGIVESGNKLVVEARMKGAGMHWAPKNVDPMVALRTVACADRWEEAWPQISKRLRERAQEHAAQRRARRQAAALAAPTLPPTPMAPLHDPPADVASPIDPAALSRSVSTRPDPDQARPRPAPRRPAANHPWRRPLINKSSRVA